MLNDQSGPYTNTGGITSVICAKQALEDFGVAAKGLNVEVITADHQNKPDLAVSIARQWFDRDGVDVIARRADVVGGAGGAVGGAGEEQGLPQRPAPPPRR